MKSSSRYILQEYANRKHLQNIRSETENTWRITYSEKGTKIELEETNSLVEDEYNLSLSSAKYLVEGTTESKETMIHHHKKGHGMRHIQFKISALKQTIRIFLDQLDDSDYEKCIKGFLHICKDIIRMESKQKKLREDLQIYFFNEDIKKLAHERRFLVEKIKKAYNSKQITADDKIIEEKNLIQLRKEHAIQAFIEW
ncbi:MAG: hypothetical protein V1725_07870 [archaeon]